MPFDPKELGEQVAASLCECFSSQIEAAETKAEEDLAAFAEGLSSCPCCVIGAKSDPKVTAEMLDKAGFDKGAIQAMLAALEVPEDFPLTGTPTQMEAFSELVSTMDEVIYNC